MSAVYISVAFLCCVVLIVWRVSKKAARAEKELQYAKKQIKDNANAADIMSKYINMPAAAVDDCVRKKRANAKKRMHSKN